MLMQNKNEIASRLSFIYINTQAESTNNNTHCTLKGHCIVKIVKHTIWKFINAENFDRRLL